MKERITFLHDSDLVPFNPQEQLRVQRNALQLSGLIAAREDRLTFGAEELPQEVLLALRQCEALHIRWVTSQSYAADAPFNARLAPGLHVFLTPNGGYQDASLLCPLLAKIFGPQVTCVAPLESFTAMPNLSDRFAPSTKFNYHASVPSLAGLSTYVTSKICHSKDPPCLKRVSALRSAQYLDIDWALSSRTMTLTVYQHAPQQTSAWNEDLTPIHATKLEVGVLTREDPIPAEAQNLGLAGLLTVVGKDEKPDSVSFTFPSRHHDISSTYAMSFVPPTGLHPTLRLSISSGPGPSSRHCRLHAHLTIPSILFPDKYQLSAPLFLESKNLRDVRAVWGETDLEAPDWVVSKWGSSMLLELAPPATADVASWHADIPLHLRYLAPTTGGKITTEVPWPNVFWACRANPETNFSSNPFDRTHLGYSGFFAPNTLFYHLRSNETASGHLRAQLEVPVLDVSRADFVEPITAAAIVIGVIWVLWKLIPTRVDSPTSKSALKEKKRR